MACWNSFERLPIFRRLSRTHKEKIMKKHVYQFGPGGADGDGTMKDVLGGKGAGLAEMCRANLPVPPGFTISTEVCNIYFENQNTVPDEIHKEMLQALEKLQKQMGQTLGDTENPLLVSVRSGAKFSMPGMMDTVLNLGLNDKTVQALERKSGNPRFAHDCYRRFIQMFGNVVLDIEKHDFDHVFDGRKKRVKAKFDTDLTATARSAAAAAARSATAAAGSAPAAAATTCAATPAAATACAAAPAAATTCAATPAAATACAATPAAAGSAAAATADSATAAATTCATPPAAAASAAPATACAAAPAAATACAAASATTCAAAPAAADPATAPASPPTNATPTHAAAGASVAATAGMATTGRRLAGAHYLAARPRHTVVLPASHLGATRRLRRLLRPSGQLQSLLRQPALLPHRHAPGYVHGLSAFPVRRVFVPAA